MRLLLWLVISIGFFLISIRHIERHCIYFPMKEIYATPKLAGLAYEEIYFITRDNKRLNGWYIPDLVFSSKFDSLSKIKKIACPKLIIHSIDDEIVPFGLGKALFDAAAPPKKFLKIRGGHNTAFLESEEGFKEGIKSFLSDLRR